MTEEERRAREVAGRAIRRLGMIEWIVLFMAALLALTAGAMAAFMLRDVASLPFRPTWAVISLLLFVIPAVSVHLRDRREDSSEPSPDGEG